jgi:uncharacterized protein
VKAFVIEAIRAYQVFISPGLPGRCKYYPSCSQYGLEAVTEYGVVRGLVLAAWRILRCNPLSYGGYDPVSRQKLFAPRCTPSHGLHADDTAPAPNALSGPNTAMLPATGVPPAAPGLPLSRALPAPRRCLGGKG